MAVFQDTMCGMWRAEIGDEISPYCMDQDEAEEAEAMLEDGMIWRDGAWVEPIICEFCDGVAVADEAICTEEGITVGECCHDELRAVSCDEQGETWYYAD